MFSRLLQTILRRVHPVKTRLLLMTLLGAVMVAACSETQSGSPTGSAQTANVSPGQAEEHRAGLMDQLDLSDVQREQIDAIFEAHKVEAEAIRASKEDGASREELRAAHKALREQIREEIGAVLTESQQAQLETLKSERGGRRHRRGGSESSPTPEMMAERLEHKMTKLTEVLGLSAEQQTQISLLFETMQAERMATDVPDRDAMRAARDAFREQLSVILTETQLQQFTDLRPGGGHRARRGFRHGR